MRRRMVRWAIVAAVLIAAGALPGDGPPRIRLDDVTEALSFLNDMRSAVPRTPGS